MVPLTIATSMDTHQVVLCLLYLLLTSASVVSICANINFGSQYHGRYWSRIGTMDVIRGLSFISATSVTTYDYSIFGNISGADWGGSIGKAAVSS